MRVRKYPRPRNLARQTVARRRPGCWAGWAWVALVTGGIFTYLATSDFSDVEKKYNPGKYDDAKTYAILQVVGYAVGSAAS